jgi:dephospho-CoA kinase
VSTPRDAAPPETASPPIGPYERRQAAVRAWDPRVAGVAARLIALIEAARPDLHVEHIGSTAVPGLPGKGIVDLGTEADPAEIPAITGAMYQLGFGPQPGPDPWPPTRPMHVGSVTEDGEEYRIHFHVHPRGAGDLAKDLRFRDALRADPALRDAYAAIKQKIVGPAGGPVDAVRYQAEKGDWILDEFDRLGIPRPLNVQGGPAGEGAGKPDDAGGTQ